MIQVTDAAQSRLQALLEDEGKLETHGLRMKVVGGGCSGLRYELWTETVDLWSKI